MPDVSVDLWKRQENSALRLSPVPSEGPADTTSVPEFWDTPPLTSFSFTVDLEAFCQTVCDVRHVQAGERIMWYKGPNGNDVFAATRNLEALITHTGRLPPGFNYTWGGTTLTPMSW